MGTTATRWVALLTICAALNLTSSPVRASPLGDAKAGQAALDQGDNATAIRLFTRALISGGLTRADRELAYVKRAKAYAAEQQIAEAEADARKALKLDPNDQEALDLLAELRTGPSLQATLEFIAQKVAEQGRIDYVESSPAPPGLKGWTGSDWRQVIDFNYDLDKCTMSYHIKEGQFLTTNFNLDITAIKGVSVDPYSKIYNGMHRNPNGIEVFEPDFFQLSMHDGSPPPTIYGELFFRDATTANRVATALKHAVQLCGRMKKEPF